MCVHNLHCVNLMWQTQIVAVQGAENNCVAVPSPPFFLGGRVQLQVGLLVTRNKNNTQRNALIGTRKQLNVSFQ